jgi:hypothetical protein
MLGKSQRFLPKSTSQPAPRRRHYHVAEAPYVVSSRSAASNYVSDQQNLISYVVSGHPAI